MTIAACFTQIATWTITGVTNWGLDDVRFPLPETDLPIVFPRLGGTGGEAMRPLGITQDQGRAIVHVDHVLVINGVGIGADWERFDDAVGFVDAYLGVVVDDLDLDGNLHEPLAIADTRAGLTELGGVMYYAVVFRHRWVVKIT